MGTKVELSERPNVNGFAFMLMFLGPCAIGWLYEMGETGVNGAFAATGLKL